MWLFYIYDMGREYGFIKSLECPANPYLKKLTGQCYICKMNIYCSLTIEEKEMFTRCKMKGAFFESCNMRGTHLIENDMTDATLDNSDATGALFSRCNVTNLSLKNTNVSGARFEDCTDNSTPITTDWLRERGALNADKAIVSRAVNDLKLGR
jgi:uncharacterized protein YjbI with pentapeptide repeats